MGLGRLLRSGRDRHETAELREEVARLRHENMTLRLDRQRPTALGQVAEQADALAAATSGQVDHTEAADEAYAAMVQMRVLRAGLLDVLQSLRVAAAQLERQLVTGVPSSEVDRRVLTGRRSADRAADGFDGTDGLDELDDELADLDEAFERRSVVPSQRRP